MEEFFKLRENGTTVSKEIIAGVTTFFAMSYILFVNPAILSQTGMPAGGVFLATIFAAVIGTLVMGLFANVPYAQAAGMGLNAFFTYTVCFGLGFTWQEALAMVFLCGLINILITVSKIRKMLISSIPNSLQNAIGGGIGVFVAYIGLKNAGLFNFTLNPGTYAFLGKTPADATVIGNAGAVPGLVNFNTPHVLLALIGIAVTIILLVLKVKGAVILSIFITTLLGIPFGVTQLGNIGISTGISKSFSELGVTFGAAFGNPGMQSLFADTTKLPKILMTIFAFSLSDTFDTIGTFIGTGRVSGIFSKEDEEQMMQSTGFKTKIDRALFADAIATSIGAVLGTSNTTTYVESAAGIGAGGRTGLTSVVVSIMFLLSIFLAPVVGIVPAEATAPVLVMVGVMMLSALKEIDWQDLAEAIPAFFAAIFMGFAYSISYGIAFGFISYCLIKVIQGKAKTIHPILWFATALFILNFVILAVL